MSLLVAIYFSPQPCASDRSAFSAKPAAETFLVIVYRGKGKLDTRLDQTGYKGIAVGFEGLVDFVFSHVPANEVVTKALREERQMFPRIAIRELIANALIHQDFEETGTSVRIELYDDRVEISNPGKPMIPVDQFRKAICTWNRHRKEGDIRYRPFSQCSILAA